MSEIFARAAYVALGYIKSWLPDGHVENGQWVCRNPMRDDGSEGSFKINLTTGAFNDYADEECVGHDAVTLYAYLNGMRNYDAAKQILEKYDPEYFPGAYGKEERPADVWRQCEKGCRDAPELPKQRNETARWPLEVRVGSEWRCAMWVVRCATGEVKPSGKACKTDYPYTLWTDGARYEWRSRALEGKYPLYNLRGLEERPNARVVLYEGQKCASVVQGVIGDGWVCVGWYGGAGNSRLTDMEPLTGREVWYPFDADDAGRKAIGHILDQVHAKVHLVYPPAGVPKGWDHADAVRVGATGADIEAMLLGGGDSDRPVSSNSDQTPVTTDVIASTRPTDLKAPVTAEMQEYVMSKVFFEQPNKKGETEVRIDSEWTTRIAEYDPVIGNSIKFDYTTGITSMCADTDQMYRGALEARISALGISATYATKNNIDRVIRSVMNRNEGINRVTDYIEGLCTHYGKQDGDDVRGAFQKLFRYHVDRNEGEDSEEYAKRCDKIDGLYAEMWDHFFTRMYGHVWSTRKKNGELTGVYENDIVPILSGPQGCGKSTLVRWLALDDALYSDLGSGLRQAFGGAETVKRVRGKLLVELGEMKIMKSADAVETIKSFISQKMVDVDIKYVEMMKQVPMTASFIGTDNEGQYLSDNTGNRRWWPVKIDSIDIGAMGDSDLAKRLAVYYAEKTRGMTMKEVMADCTPSAELAEFIEAERHDALITYSDYEEAVSMVTKWKGDAMNIGMPVTQAEVEKLAFDDGYRGRISQRSCARAFEDCGLERRRVRDGSTGLYRMSWVWTGARPQDRAEKRKDGEEIPF